MAVAFVFPGQGSQTVGMGKTLAANFAAARQVFEEVDSALGGKLSSIIFEGPADTLMLTENAQPALMAVSLAATRVLQAEAGLDLAREAKFVAGHSTWRILGAGRDRCFYGGRCGAASAHTGAGHAKGGSGRCRGHGGADRPRL